MKSIKLANDFQNLIQKFTLPVIVFLHFSVGVELYIWVAMFSLYLAMPSSRKLNLPEDLDGQTHSESV